MGSVSMLGGRVEAVVSNSFVVGMSSASPRPWASVASMERCGCINFFIWLALRSLVVFFLILYKDVIALLFHHFAG